MSVHVQINPVNFVITAPTVKFTGTFTSYVAFNQLKKEFRHSSTLSVDHTHPIVSGSSI